MIEIKDKIVEIVQNELGSKGFDLVDIDITYRRKSYLIQVLADKPEGGIVVDECVKLNKDIGRVLEIQDFLSDGYVLEVSSPGLDRDLRTQRDFRRIKGKDIHLFLKEEFQGKCEYQATLVEVNEKDLILKLSNEEIVVPLILVNKAKQII